MSLTNLTPEQLQILYENADAVIDVSSHLPPISSGSHYTINNADKPYTPPTLTIGNTTFTEPELIALKELLKSTNPELYI